MQSSKSKIYECEDVRREREREKGDETHSDTARTDSIRIKCNEQTTYERERVYEFLWIESIFVCLLVSLFIRLFSVFVGNIYNKKKCACLRLPFFSFVIRIPSKRKSLT